MLSIMRSIWVWIANIGVILLWLPLVAMVRLFDRSPARIHTGRLFRRLGAAMVKINPVWRVHVEGVHNVEPGMAYVVISNHQSMVDIPIICLLPWEMKWMAKAELFRVPLVGWMMRMAGDIPVERGNRQGAGALLQAKRVLGHKCSVMIFPEGTRSPDSSVQPFTDGAFHLAIKARVPILPLVVEGSHSCLTKGSWKFGEAQDIILRVLPPVDTQGLTTKETPVLRERVRSLIMDELARLRNLPVEAVDTSSAGPGLSESCSRWKSGQRDESDGTRLRRQES